MTDGRLKVTTEAAILRRKIVVSPVTALHTTLHTEQHAHGAAAILPFQSQPDDVASVGRFDCTNMGVMGCNHDSHCNRERRV